MHCSCRKGVAVLLRNPREWSINSQRSAIVRGESRRATYRMHHFQLSDIYETGSRLT
jgi:hypothetical protein